MFKFLSIALLLLATFGQVIAQCNGVYFKENKRQMVSQPFAKWYFEDIDNDGLKDLVGYNSLATGYSIYFYKRLSADAFDPVARESLGIRAITLTSPVEAVRFFGDVNNDGKKDLIVQQLSPAGSPFPFIFRTYLNDSEGRFTATTVSTFADRDPNSERIIATADLNADGKADILTSAANVQNGSTLYYRLTLADNSFGAAVFIRTIANYIHSNITVEDLNGDGINDIAFSRGGDLTIMTGSQGPTFTETYSNFSFRNNSRSTDFNGDSKKDFVGTSVGSNPSTRIIKIAINAGNNTFSTSELEIPSYYYDAAKYGDFNGDGLQDLLFSAGNKNLLLKNLGNNNFLSQEFRSAIGESISDRVDLDAKVDTISLRRRYLNPMVESEGGQRLAFTSVAFNKNVCDPVGQTKIVDFDGDGTIDRAFWNPTTGYWRRYTPVSQFGNYQQVFFQFGSGSFGDVPVQNDYDGDGRTDYAVYRRSTGTWYVHRSSDQQYTIFRFGIAEDKPVAADYDNDGKADFAVYRPSSGVWYIWLSQAQQLYAARFGIAEDKPVPVDYDGDGRTDIAVYRPSTGVWYRINSSDSSYSVVHYGISSDRPIPADFDGDGKANVAVFRDGVWYVLRSDFSTTVLFYGIAGDIPAFGPGGFNYGDGRETLFTFRRSNNRFYEEGRIDPHIVGDTTNELFVSTVLSAE